MKQVTAHHLVLAFCLALLILYATFLGYTQVQQIQAQEQSPDQAPPAPGAASLAILANTPTPTPVSMDVEADGAADTAAMKIASEIVAQRNAAQSSAADSAMLMPTSGTGESAADPGQATDRQLDTIVVLLPTATPAQHVAASPLVPAPTPVAATSAHVDGNGSQNGPTLVQERAVEVVIAPVTLPTATPTLVAAAALALAADVSAPVAAGASEVPLAPESLTNAPALAVEPAAAAAATGGCQITSPPSALGLDPFYHKYCAAFGLPIIASADVSDLALQRTWSTVMTMLDGIAQAEEVHHAMNGLTTRIAIIGMQQVPTDMPEFHNLYTMFPNVDWNNRTRGIGATQQIPLLAIGEENVLCDASDQWVGQNLLVHEFAHAIKNMGLDLVNPNLHHELERVYQDALANGRWAGTYAASNVEEYWAEGVRIYFRLAGEPNAPGGQLYPASTRAELERYDPDLYRLIENIFGPREAIVRC